MIYKDIKQGSEAWFQMRLGKITASRVTDVMAKIKTGEAAGRKNYKAELIAERLTNIVQPMGFTSAAMVWGTESEPQARAAYEFINDVDVELITFVDHPTIGHAGASPDGFVGDDGLLEIKNPNTATHIDYLLNRKIPKKYINQMQWQMACTDRQWCDWMSFDSRMPEHLNKLIIRVPRDNAYINEIEREVAKFNEEIIATVKKLEALAA